MGRLSKVDWNETSWCWVVFLGDPGRWVEIVTFSAQQTQSSLFHIYTHRSEHIYIIISENIRYLLWNRGRWRSLNNTYPIFLTPYIRCTNHLCDSCDLTDVNPHFIPSLLRMIQNVDLLWRHRYKSRSPAIVTSQWPILPACLLWTLS